MLDMVTLRHVTSVCAFQSVCVLLRPSFMQAFIERSNSLVTCSKDGYVRVWDLGTQHCYQILLGQQGEVKTSTALPLSN